MPTMDRLSGLDASFLYLESPAQLMHVCGLVLVDPATIPEGYSFATLRAGIDERVRDVAHFTRKLKKVPLRVAVFTKMHHASEPLGLGGKGTYGRAPRDLELLGRGVLNQVSRPLSIPRLVGPSTQLIAGSLNRARKGTAMAAPFSAPRTSFNGTITGHRSIAMATMSLDDIKTVKEATGSTVNDVVMAVTGGALRSYLADRGELPATSLLATVPVSVRTESKREKGANKVSALFARLGTDLEDPLERLHELTAANRHAKGHQKAISADALQDWAEFASPSTFGLAMRAYAGLRLAEKHPVVHNLVVSNVPGPPVPLYFVGARIEGMFAFGPVFHGAGLNITVMSNNGEMQVGVIACRESVADVDDLVRRFPAELAVLVGLVGRGGLTDAARPSVPQP
jgi:diacylglycerol O-acyltransferase